MGIGLGTSDPILLPRTTQLLAFKISSRFWSIGRSSSIVVWLLITVGLSGCFWLIRAILVNANWIATIAALFYFFNFYIRFDPNLGRYITAGIFAWAYLLGFCGVGYRGLILKQTRYWIAFIIPTLFATAFGSQCYLYFLGTSHSLWHTQALDKMERSCSARLDWWSWLDSSKSCLALPIYCD